MALTYGTATTVDQGTTGTSPIVIAKPGSTVAGSLLLAVISHSAVITSITPPSGWTQIARTATATTCAVTTFYRICDGTEGSSFSFTSGGTNQIWAGCILRYAGSHPTTPVDDWAPGTGTAVTLTANAPTTTAADETITNIYVTWADETITMGGSGQVQRVNFGSNGDGVLVTEITQATAGTGSSVVSTQSVTNGWCTQAIAWKNAPVAPSVPVTYGSSTTVDGGNPGVNPIVIAKPSGTVAGSTLLMAVVHNETQSFATTTPTGWFPIQTRILSSGFFALTLFVRTCDGTEGSTFSFGTPAGLCYQAACVRYEGANQQRPYAAITGATLTGSTTLTAPALTTTAIDETITCVFYNRSDPTINNTVGTVRVDASGALSTGLSISDYTQAAIGSTGTKTATIDVTSSWVAIQIEWRRAATRLLSSVGFGTVQFTATSGAALVPDLGGTTVVAGDALVLHYAKSNNDDLATPAGWTELLPTNQNNTTAQRVEVFVKRMTAYDAATVSLPGAANNVVRGARVVAIRGVPLSGNIEDWITAGRSNNAASLTMTPPVITPPNDVDCILLWLGAYEDDPDFSGTPPGYTGSGVTSPSSLGTDMNLAWAVTAWPAGSGATTSVGGTVSSGTFAASPNVVHVLAFSSGPPPLTSVTVSNPQIITGSVLSQSLLYTPVFTPSVIEVVTSTSITARVGVTPSVISVVTATSASLALAPRLTTAASTSQSLIFAPIIAPSIVSVIATTSVSVRLTITSALLAVGTATSQSLALRVTPLLATTAVSTTQSLALSPRTDVATSLSITANVSLSTNTNVTDVATSVASVSISLGINPRVSAAARTFGPTVVITSPPVTDLITVATSTSVNLALSAQVVVVSEVVAPTLAIGVTASVTVAVSTSITVALVVVPAAVSVGVATAVSLALPVGAAVVAVSTDALVGLIIVPGAVTVSAGVVAPRVGYVIPSTLAVVMVGVIDPSLVRRGRYRLAGTIRLVREVTGTLSARPRV